MNDNARITRPILPGLGNGEKEILCFWFDEEAEGVDSLWAQFVTMTLDPQ